MGPYFLWMGLLTWCVVAVIDIKQSENKLYRSAIHLSLLLPWVAYYFIDKSMTPSGPVSMAVGYIYIFLLGIPLSSSLCSIGILLLIIIPKILLVIRKKFLEFRKTIALYSPPPEDK